MSPSGRLAISGRPTGAPTWRQHVAAQAATVAGGASGLELAFTLPPTAWVDVDTLVENTLAGLRDAGALAPRYAGLDALVATKSVGEVTGALVQLVDATTVQRRRPPGRVELEVSSPRMPRAADRAQKRAWRERIAEQWRPRPQLVDDVWADVALGVRGSLLGPLEVVLDALEPVLGRDARGRDWQEFFPNDHRVLWLRVSRQAASGVRLRLGPLTRARSCS